MPDSGDETLTIRPRLVVVEMVYHQRPGEQPQSTESRFSRWLQSREQTYYRQTKADKNWRNLDAGWMEKTGMMVLKNDEKAGGGILELGSDEDVTAAWTIQPGESMRGCPANIKALCIRCPSGEACYSITLLPS